MPSTTDTASRASRHAGKRRAAILISAAPAVALAAGAVAQTAPPPAHGVEEVVVTARHRAEKAQKVPISLTSIGAAKLAANGTTSLTQLQVLVPSLQITDFNPRNTSFNIRGIGNNVTIANDGLESGVGIYVDGVFYARPAQAAFAFPDLDNIQVLRGPQGTLFGKNTTAGAVDVHTERPSFTPQATLEASVGNYGYWQTKGTVSDGFNDKVAARVSFLADQRNGTETSIGTGQHYNTLDDKAGRVQLLVLPTDELTLRVIGDFAHQMENCCVAFPTGVFTKFADGTTIPYNVIDRERYTGYTIPTFNAFERDAAINRPTYYGMDTGGVSAQADYELNGFTLTSISAWRFWNWKPYNGAFDAIGLNVLDAYNNNDFQRQVTQELRVTSPTGGPIDYTGGFFFFYQDLPGSLLETFGKDAGAWLAGPKLPPALSNLLFNNLNIFAKTDSVTNSYAGYGQATWHALEKLDITGGLRYTYEDKSGSFAETQFGAAPLTGLPPAIAAAFKAQRDALGPPLYYNAHASNGAVSYLLSATYKFTGDALAYANYSRGSKSEGINVSNLPPGISAIVKPERVDNYELGVKSSWLNNRIVANADVFWLEDTDYQGIAVAPLGPGVYTTYFSSVPKVRSRGFEFDTHARPYDWLMLNMSGAYTDAIYESYPQGPCSPEVSGASAAICNLSGKNVPGISRWTLSLGGDIAQPAGSIGRYDLLAYFGADFSLRSNFNVSASDSIYAKTPGYGLLNARLGVRTEDGKYDAFLWSHNATNTKYYEVLSPAQPFSGLIDGIPGDPIMFGATVRVHL